MGPPIRHGRSGPYATDGGLLTLAEQLSQKVASGVIDQQLCAKVRTALGNHNSGQNRAATNPAEYDKKGTEIWNAATRLHRDDSSESANPTKVLPLIRAFALLLLHTAHQASSKKSSSRPESTVRMLRTSLKAAKTCIDGSELDIASEILQRAADYVENLTSNDRRTHDDSKNPIDTTAAELSGEYWTLRAALSWKQNRLDTAASYLGKVDTGLQPSSSVAEKIADLGYEISKDFLKAKKYEEAIKWLDKASAAIDSIEQEQLSQEALELRTAILAELVRALLAHKTTESIDRALDVLSYLDAEGSAGPRIGIYLLKFQALEARESKDASEYDEVLRQMIRTTILSPQTFRTIMFHVQKLHKLNVALARESLDSLMGTRLCDHGEMDLIEKATVMRIWSSAQASSDAGSVDSLCQLLEDISNNLPDTFSEQATHAAQTLLWKATEAASEANHPDIAEKWCRLSAHRLFAKAGNTNKIKIARKAMIMALANGQHTRAREVFFQMPEAGQEAPASQFLLYRVALHEGDEDTMEQCLAKLVKAPESDAQYLYACVQEAQRSGSKQHAIAVLQHVLEKFGTNVPSGVHLPALLRCTLQMMLHEVENDATKTTAAIGECCQIMTAAVNHFKKTEPADMDTDTRSLELEWFAKTSYNLALKYFDALEPDLVLQLVSTCTSFTTSLLSTTTDSSSKNKLLTRSLLCHYLSASILIVLARGEDTVSLSEIHYLSALHHCTSFTSLLPAVPLLPAQDIKASQMLHYEIEALLKTHQWDALDAILQRCIDIPSPSPEQDLSTFADLIISVHAAMVALDVPAKHRGRIPKVMQGIINAVYAREGDMVKLAKWLRCVFRMTVGTDEGMALRVVEQVGRIVGSTGARRGGEGGDRGDKGEKGRYPPDELEWLACTAFNVGVDRYCAQDEEGCRVWAEAALNLAQRGGEGGVYARMQGVWGRLRREEGM
ncbi:Meiosis protein SPO22/ZIP4-like protein [Elsinoe fawcettii]|nr:Meiosis protein SPO22/ZIP4-like protein [Elsinoe fawcettii]